MRAGFRDWLDGRYSATVAATRWSSAQRVELAYGNLDGHFERDELADLIHQLTYSTADQRADIAPRARIEIDGNARTGLASLKQAVRLYRDYRCNL